MLHGSSFFLILLAASVHRVCIQIKNGEESTPFKPSCGRCPPSPCLPHGQNPENCPPPPPPPMQQQQHQRSSPIHAPLYSPHPLRPPPPPAAASQTAFPSAPPPPLLRGAPPPPPPSRTRTGRPRARSGGGRERRALSPVSTRSWPAGRCAPGRRP